MKRSLFLPDDEHLIVQRRGHELRILSKFTDEKNILLRFVEGNMIAGFMKNNDPIECFYKAEVFHYGWDDLAPWIFGGYETIGANHGSIFAFRVSLLRHWLFEEDIGKVFTDNAGNEFVLVAVENLSNLIFHSRAVPVAGRIKFADKICGNLASADGTVIVPDSVARIQMPNYGNTLSVHNRYNNIEILADEKPLKDGEIVRCSQVRSVQDTDVCPADTLCEYLIKNPGRYVAPNAPGLESMLHTSLTYTFLPSNTMHAVADIEFLRDIDHPVRYGLLQYYGEKFFAVQEKFVPKLKAFTWTDACSCRHKIDPGGIWQVPESGPPAKSFSESDCCCENDPPCRYIDFFGDGKKRELGVALGYSRIHGMTAAGAPARKGINFILPTTGKIYPYALSLPKVNKHERFTISAYRQFFVPDPQFNGAMFGHYEGDSYCFYADCADGACCTLQLPEKFAGKKFEVIERYGRAEIPENRLLDQNGKITIDLADRSGLAIKVKI